MATKSQTQRDTDIILHNDVRTRIAQKIDLTDLSYTVSTLSFLLKKIGTPADVNITFIIRQTDDTILESKVWGTAASLQTTEKWETVTFDAAQLVNEEARFCVEYAGTGGYPNDAVVVRYLTDQSVLDDEIMDWYPTGGPWSGGESGVHELAYSFEYTVSKPVVTTQANTDVSPYSALGRGYIQQLGTSAVTQHGHVWSTSQNPTTSDSKTENGAAPQTGSFMSLITDLVPGTTYYFRAYATNGTGTAYGEQVSNVMGTTIGRREIWTEGKHFHFFDEAGAENKVKGVGVASDQDILAYIGGF